MALMFLAKRRFVTSLTIAAFAFSGCLQAGDPQTDAALSSGDGVGSQGNESDPILTAAELAQFKALLQKHGADPEKVADAYAEAAKGGDEAEVAKRRDATRQRFQQGIDAAFGELPEGIVTKLHRALPDLSALTTQIANPYGPGLGGDIAADQQCSDRLLVWLFGLLFRVDTGPLPCGTISINLNSGMSGAVQQTTASVRSRSTYASTQQTLQCITQSGDNATDEPTRGRFAYVNTDVPPQTLFARANVVVDTAGDYDVEGLWLLLAPGGYGRTIGAMTVTSHAVERALGTGAVSVRDTQNADELVISRSTYSHERQPLMPFLSFNKEQWLGFSSQTASVSKTVDVAVTGYVHNWGWGSHSTYGRICSVVEGDDTLYTGGSYLRLTWFAFLPPVPTARPTS